MRPLTCNNPFGAWLRGQMIDSNVTERELATILGIHYATISYHLNGKRNPSLKTIYKYAQYFEEDVWYLYELVLDS